MASEYRMEHKEVIRVKAKKFDGMLQPDCKKFCIDPQITSFEMLQNLLARAFNIKSDFTVSYIARDEYGQDVYLSMLSDWDMDAAFQGSADPCLKLKVDLRPFDEGLEDWDVIATVDIPSYKLSSLIEKSSVLSSITGTISSHVEKRVNQMQKAMGLKPQDDQQYKPLKPPICDSEFFNYLDSSGQIIKPNELRLSVYQGGIEPSLRRVVWRHLLNLFPPYLSGRERFDYMKGKENEYYTLRDAWKYSVNSGMCSEELRYIMSSVKKDVLRTDRTNSFYAGSDDNTNVLALFHILVTFAVTHPEISYCQGMSDIASPLLVTQKDEAQTYLCLCGLMQRLRHNFKSDGVAMTTMFQHLTDLLQLYDPVFFAYLEQCSAQDLFFCYRWLLLEVKREFPLEDALYMLEVMWSTLPPDPPVNGMELVDPDYNPAHLLSTPNSPPFATKQTMYARFLARHRKNSVMTKDTTNVKLKASFTSSLEQQLADNSMNNNSEISTDYSPSDEKSITESHDYSSIDVDDPMTRSLKAKSSCIDRSLEPVSISPSSDNSSLNSHMAETYVNGSVSCTGESQRHHEILENCDKGNKEEKGIPDIESAKGVSNADGVTEKCRKRAPLNIYIPPPLKNHQVQLLDENVISEESSIGCDSAEYPRSQTSIRIEHTNICSSSVPLERNSQTGECTDMDKESMETGDLAISNEQVNCIDNVSSRMNFLSNNATEISVPAKVDDGSTSEVPTRATMHLSDCREATEQYHSTPGTTPQSPEQNSDGFIKVSDRALLLPLPHEFGAGNPFLMFVCLTLLLQHRDHIMKNRMDYDELAMYFDKMVRKHNVHKVLHQARLLYSEYLRLQQQTISKEQQAEKEKENELNTSM